MSSYYFDFYNFYATNAKYPVQALLQTVWPRSDATERSFWSEFTLFVLRGQGILGW